MDDNSLLIIVLAFVLGYMASGMMKTMCGGRLVEFSDGTSNQGSNNSMLQSFEVTDASYNDVIRTIYDKKLPFYMFGKDKVTTNYFFEINEWDNKSNSYQSETFENENIKNVQKDEYSFTWQSVSGIDTDTYKLINFSITNRETANCNCNSRLEVNGFSSPAKYLYYPDIGYVVIYRYNPYDESVWQPFMIIDYSVF